MPLTTESNANVFMSYKFWYDSAQGSIDLGLFFQILIETQIPKLSTTFSQGYFPRPKGIGGVDVGYFSISKIHQTKIKNIKNFCNIIYGGTYKSV